MKNLSDHIKLKLHDNITMGKDHFNNNNYVDDDADVDESAIEHYESMMNQDTKPLMWVSIQIICILIDFAECQS